MMTPDPFPPKYAAGYLNSREIQLDLGVPLNITALAPAVYDRTDVFRALAIGPLPSEENID